MRKERDPKPLGDLMQLLVAGRGWGERMYLDRLVQAWPEVVGPQIAARSEPVRLAQGVLTVRADPGAWAAELTLLGPSLAARASEALGEGAVREVRVQAASRGSTGPSERG